MPHDSALPRFLAEWYVQPLGEQTIANTAAQLRQALATTPVDSRRTALICAVYVAPEEYAFMVFAADSADLITQACEDAGYPADRVTAALEAPPVSR